MKPLLVAALWLGFAVVVGGVVGFLYLFAGVSDRSEQSVQDHLPVVPGDGSGPAKIAGRLGGLTEAERATDDPIRRAVLAAGATALRIGRGEAGITVTVQLNPQEPEHICYAFAVPPYGASVPYSRLPSCPSS
ncbi:hypothetical protein [Amycolatopsis solani]|uniref:hypothetical protein n=1 Tax=Amycolatopsis solani TaxID=3028615 RepID=UPI0025AEE052|nr:hypothetical protein [Amycolatopsis sp. MEP2-6]